jgi:NADH dehydrogenase
MNGASAEESPRVVILGAGFGGIGVARALASVPVHTTIVDRNYYNTFQPLLYQVATGGLNAGDVAYPVRNLLRRRHGLDFRWGSVERVDADKRAVFLGDGTELRYDYLVIATGATINYFGVPGAAEHAKAIYTLDDALAVRRRMFEQFERAASIGGGGGELNVVIVGGGATGVEMAGALAELRTLILGSSYPSLDPQMGSVVLVEQKEALLGGFDAALARYAERELTRRGVEVRLSTSVHEVSAAGLTIDDDDGASTFLPAGLVVWAAGVAASSVAASAGLPLTANGRIEVGPNLAVPGRPEVFAIGDVAASPAPGGGHPLAQLAQPAIQGGHHAAREIAAALSGAQPTPFSYKDKGIMATIGRRSAVAEIALPATRRHLQVRGTPAWLAWLGLHIYFLLGGRNRAAVLLNWAWRYVSWRRGPRVIVGG